MKISKILISTYSISFNIKIFKKTMFTKKNVNSLVLKKSGEITTNMKINRNNINQLRLHEKFNNLIIDFPKTKVGYISEYSTYNKLNPNNMTYSFPEDYCLVHQFPMKYMGDFQKELCINRCIKGEVPQEKMLDYFKCINSVIRGVNEHTVVTEKIKETEHSVTFFYYVITTSSSIVDYGGVNKFKPIFLCNYGEKSFYTIPLLCIDTIKKDKFEIIYSMKNKEEFRDNKELREIIVNEIIKMENNEDSNIKQLNIREDLFEKDFDDMNFLEPFKNKNPEYKITPLSDDVHY